MVDRIRLGRSVVHSILYRENLKRSNCTVSYTEGQESGYGQVIYFLKITTCSNVEYVAIVNELQRTGEVLSGGFIQGVRFQGQAAIPVEFLQEMCFFVNTGESLFISKIPNTVERE